MLLLHNTVGKGLEEITWTFSLKNFRRALWDCLLKYSTRPVQKNNICHECSTYLKIELWTIFQYHYQYSSIIIIIIVVITKWLLLLFQVFCYFFSTHTCHSTLYFADLPYNLLVNGKLNQTVPAMIGVTRNEGGFFVLPLKGKDIVLWSNTCISSYKLTFWCDMWSAT